MTDVVEDAAQEPKNTAQLVIAKLGGNTAVAAYLKIGVAAVCRWGRPVEKGGRGGIIPPARHAELLDLAQQRGIALTLDEIRGK